MGAKVYRIAPELRRCCWYVLVAVPPSVALQAWLGLDDPKRDLLDVFFRCGFFAAVAGALLVPLHWRLRIDQDGLARRLLLGWDAWTWADLASGRIHKLHPHTLLDPARPWWRRRLRLDYLTAGDRDEVVAALNAHYRLPPPPDVPDALTIHYGFRRRATLSPAGIGVHAGRTLQEYAWRDVRSLHIRRLDPLRRDFASLELLLPDQAIELKLVTHHVTTPSWRGPGPEVMAEFLMRHLPAEKVEASLVGQAPRRGEHVERQLAKVKKVRRELRFVAGGLLLLFAALLFWTVLDNSGVGILIVAGVQGSCLGLVLLWLDRSQGKEVRELEERLRSV